MHLDVRVRPIQPKENLLAFAVVFPALSLILVVAFFVKVVTTHFDYRKRGQFEWAAPAILFARLVFSLIAPQFIWAILS